MKPSEVLVVLVVLIKNLLKQKGTEMPKSEKVVELRKKLIEKIDSQRNVNFNHAKVITAESETIRAMDAKYKIDKVKVDNYAALKKALNEKHAVQKEGKSKIKKLVAILMLSKLENDGASERFIEEAEAALA